MNTKMFYALHGNKLVVLLKQVNNTIIHYHRQLEDSVIKDTLIYKKFYILKSTPKIEQDISNLSFKSIYFIKI